MSGLQRSHLGNGKDQTENICAVILSGLIVDIQLRNRDLRKIIPKNTSKHWYGDGLYGCIMEFE